VVVLPGRSAYCRWALGGRKIDWGREMVRRAPGFIWAQLNRIMWRELWIGVAVGEAIALLGLWGYAYLSTLAR